MSASNAGHPNAGRANVSVTNINCENPLSVAGGGGGDGNNDGGLLGGNDLNVGAHCSQQQQNNFYSKGSIRISVPKMEESDESDTELSNIEKTSKVNMRNSRAKGTVPRPMSWEGELSEHDDMMDTENSQSASLKAVSVIGSNGDNNEPINATMTNKTTIQTHSFQPEVKPVILQETVKTEAGHYPVETNQAIHYPNTLASAGNKKYPSEVMNLKYEPGLLPEQAINSPLLMRSKQTMLPANPSPDSAIHSVYTHSSPSQSPLTSRHAPYTPSLSRNNSDASHSSCYSYSSEFSPTHSPIQGRHPMYSTNTFNGSPLHHSIYRPPIMDGSDGMLRLQTGDDPLLSEGGDHIPSAGISRQQLINSPCPICGDKISGFHYGIFSCESCKGFFKRTVQNRKNYVCIRGALCPVTIATRKKCPACRFDKCLQKGMKLEAIREDRTRGGRSTYQCSYTLPGTILNPSMLSDGSHMMHNHRMMQNGVQMLKQEQSDSSSSSSMRPGVPTLLQEIMDVEHLWQYNEAELSRLNQPVAASSSGSSSSTLSSNPLLASAGLNGDNSNPDLIANLCNIADHRLYKIVKWCKSLPLFKNISIDDQICLLINSWCELLLFSCCFRSMATPGEIRISLGKSITLAQAKHSGLQACIERMLNLTDHLRRLRVDKYEYVAMKVIVLLSSDTAELKESEKVRASQEKALQALQAYTLSHYPESPAKFGELLLRIPELQRTCQVGKEMLTIKSKEGEEPSFNLLMELLRGEH